jgi:glycogenin glucosyltransferase
MGEGFSPSDRDVAKLQQDPAAQLERLARRQSDVLANKLGTDGTTREIPMRPLPYGSEGVTSPTYVPQGPKNGGIATSESTPRATIEEPSYHGPSAAWEKDETFPTHETPLPPSEEERDVLDT